MSTTIATATDLNIRDNGNKIIEKKYFYLPIINYKARIWRAFIFYFLS
jgi:hypothetical protein